jgi:hypothetical protein
MSEVTTFLLEFISQEPGTRHIPSDNYAISIILPCLSLIEQGEISFTQEFIKDITVWLCDRFEDGIGLGSFGSTEFDEVKVLLGEAFDFIDTSRNGSFLAALISDLSIFLGNKEFYEDVLNDISAVNISYNYWQVNDTKGMFIINGEDIITYPGIDYREGTVIFSEYTFADHIMHEVIDYSLSDFLDVEEFVPTLILLLRDRYFPTLWRKLIKSE